MSVTVSEKNKVTLFAPPQKNGGKEIYYPESDGKPVAETEIHINRIFNLYGLLRNYFSDKAGVAVIADMMFYYEKGNTRKSIAPDVMVVKGVHKNPRRVFKLWEKFPTLFLKFLHAERGAMICRKSIFFIRNSA